jgi:hypothetical protein
LVDLATCDDASAFEITEEGLAALAEVETVEPDLQSAEITAESQQLTDPPSKLLHAK